MRNPDSMRYHLVTSFVCAKCGDKLALSYDVPKAAGFQGPDDGITGAAKVEANIAIHPCERCYGAVTAPIKALRQALAATETIGDAA